MECNKDEAVKAKQVAEDKLRGGDPLAAQKFVGKAERLFSGLEGLQQLTSVIQVHIAAQHKVNGETDWYAILQLPPLTSDEATIKKHYRKKALLLHPDKNQAVGAEAAFKLVGEAFSLLSDKSKKAAHDFKRQVPAVAPRSAGARAQQQAQSRNQYKPAAPKPAAQSRGFPSSSHAQAGPQGAAKGPSSTPQVAPPDQFYTACPNCKMQLLCKISAMHQSVTCIICRMPFVASETGSAAGVPPPAGQAPGGYQQQAAANGMHMPFTGQQPHFQPQQTYQQAAAAAAHAAAAAATAAAAAAAAAAGGAPGMPGAYAANGFHQGPQAFPQGQQGFQFHQFFPNMPSAQQHFAQAQGFGPNGMPMPGAPGPGMGAGAGGVGANDIVKEAWRQVQTAKAEAKMKEAEEAEGKKRRRELEKEEKKKQREKEKEERQKQREAAAAGRKGKLKKKKRRHSDDFEDSDEELVMEDEDFDLVNEAASGAAAGGGGGVRGSVMTDGDVRRSSRQRRQVVYSVADPDLEEVFEDAIDGALRGRTKAQGQPQAEAQGQAQGAGVAEGAGVKQEARVDDTGVEEVEEEVGSQEEEEEEEEAETNMDVKDADFHNFDSDRDENSIHPNQVWALYDDEGLPRFYAVVKTVTLSPKFKCTVAWLDPKWKEAVPGCPRTVGPIVKSRSTGTQDAVSVFSHLVEPQSKFPLKVLPKLGEIWACFVPAMPAEEEAASLGLHGFRALRDASTEGEKNAPPGGHLVYVLAQISGEVDEEETDGAIVVVTYLRKVPGYNSVYEQFGAPCSLPIQRLSHLVPSQLNYGHEANAKGLPPPPDGTIDVDLAGMPNIVVEDPEAYPQLIHQSMT